MAFRFRRRLKIAPGLTLNLSKSGASVSAGPRGARFTIGRGGTRETVGLPGSGLSYSTPRRASSEGRKRAQQGLGAQILAFFFGLGLLWLLGKLLGIV